MYQAKKWDDIALFTISSTAAIFESQELLMVRYDKRIISIHCILSEL